MQITKVRSPKNINKMKSRTMYVPAFCFLLIQSTVFGQVDNQKIAITVHEGTNMAAALSPDGKWIAVDLQGTIGVLPSEGGKVKLLTDGMGDERQPSWSPDGSKIVFHSYRDGTYHIWSINKDGSDLKQLTFGIYDEREPYMSSDGTRIVFSSDRGGNYDIWELNLTTKALKQLTKDPANDYHPTYSSDGKKVVFVSERQTKGVYILDESGKEELAVANARSNSPAFSSDGKRIVFNSTTGSKSDLVLATLGSKEIVTLSAANADVFPFRPSWSSTNEILYTSDGKIMMSNPDKKSSRIIPFEVSLEVINSVYAPKKRDFDDDKIQKVKGVFSPVVSPDGESVCFTALGDLWLVKKGSDKPVAITSDKFQDIDAAWSYDGKKIVFSSDRSGGSMNLWLYELSTKKFEQLTHYDKHALTPSFSPDGKKIAFFLNDEYTGFGKASLYSLDVATKEPKLLHKSLFTPGKPTWSGDGKWIVLSALQPYSSRYREGISKELLVAANGESSRYLSFVEGRSLAQRGKDGPVWSPDGNKMAFIQDGTLWTVDVDAAGGMLTPPVRITNEMSETPSWTGDSKSIVYVATDQLKKVDLASGKTEVIPVSLEYKPQKASGTYVIHAGRLFDGKSSSYLKNMDVVVENNRIKEVVAHKAKHDGNWIDASDKVVMPGLFEMHTHQNGSGGELLGRNWLSYGITSVRETGGDPYDAVERKEAWVSGVRQGPRLFYTGPLMDGPRVYYELASGMASPAQLDWELDRAAKLDYDFIKTYVRFPDDWQKKATAFAHEHGIPVSSHEIYPATSYGVDAVEHMSATSRRGYSPKMTALSRSYEDVIQILAKSGMSMTPTVALYGGFYSNWRKSDFLSKNKQLNGLYTKEYIEGTTVAAKKMSQLYPDSEIQFEGIKSNLLKMYNQGVRMTAGTDSPFITYGLSLHVELHNFVEAGLTPFQALQSSMIHAAESIGVSKDLGTIEQGKLADITIVSGDPLKNIKDALNVEIVFKNGIRYNIDDLLKGK